MYIFLKCKFMNYISNFLILYNSYLFIIIDTFLYSKLHSPANVPWSTQAKRSPPPMSGQSGTHDIRDYVYSKIETTRARTGDTVKVMFVYIHVYIYSYIYVFVSLFYVCVYFWFYAVFITIFYFFFTFYLDILLIFSILDGGIKQML